MILIEFPKQSEDEIKVKIVHSRRRKEMTAPILCPFCQPDSTGWHQPTCRGWSMTGRQMGLTPEQIIESAWSKDELIASISVALLAERRVAFERAAQELESCLAAWGTAGDYLLFGKQLVEKIRELK